MHCHRCSSYDLEYIQREHCREFKCRECGCDWIEFADWYMRWSRDAVRAEEMGYPEPLASRYRREFEERISDGKAGVSCLKN